MPTVATLSGYKPTDGQKNPPVAESWGGAWTLEVECLLTHRQRRLFRRLGQRWVRVADAGDVFATSAELHGDHGLGDQLAGLRADDVNAQNLIGHRVCQELDHTGGVAQSARPVVGQEGECAGFVGHAIGFELLQLGRHHVRGAVI